MLRLYRDDVPEEPGSELLATPQPCASEESDEVKAKRIETLRALLQRKGFHTVASQLAPLHRYRNAPISQAMREAVEHLLRQAQRAVTIHDPRDNIHDFNRCLRVVGDILAKRGMHTANERIEMLAGFLSKAQPGSALHRAIGVLLAEETEHARREEGEGVNPA